jgi:hypothetical protein
MSTKVVLGTTAQLDSQLVRDMLTDSTAMELVRDWLGEYLDAAASVRSWTPYWKEIVLRQPGNILVSLRFRLGGPVEVSQSHGWALSKAELAGIEQALIRFLDELGQAMCQQRVADAVQSQYADASRRVQDDDTLLLQFRAPPATAALGTEPAGLIEMAMFVRQNQTINVFAHCADETVGRATIRRLLANLQVAGIPLKTTNPVIERR